MAKERTKMFSQVEEKLQNDMEVTNILTQIRNSNDIFKNLKFKNKKALLNVNKSRVLMDENENEPDRNGDEIEVPS